ncbi:hypothetical protein CK215_21995 [Mesorhizobium sp. WSM3864]|nr:hypothetical protein CK215_21995 [Mesorhizobium sp. WSM3864]
MEPGVPHTNGAVAVVEPRRVFGKLATKRPLAVAVARAGAKDTMAVRARAALSSHGQLAVKIYVALWMVALLASVFLIVKG